MDKQNAIGWFELYVQDLPRAKAFYETVFAVTLEQIPQPEIEMWAFPMHMEAGGAPGALIKMEGVPSGPGGTLVYFNCEDCAIEEARVTDAGGSIYRPKMSIGDYGFITLANDTEGNMIGLHSQK